MVDVKYDVLVIGAGLAGSIACSRIIELNSRLNICCIDSGPELSLPILDHGLAHVPVRSSGKGGTTALWHNGLILPSANESCQIHSIIKKFIPEAFKLLSGEKVNLDVDTLFYKNKIIAHLHYPKRRRYCPPEVVKCYWKATLEKVINSEPGYKCTLDIDGEKINLDAKIIVIAAGCFGTQDLLNDLFKKNINYGFFDHPMGFVGKVRFKENSKLKEIVEPNYGDGFQTNKGVVISSNNRSSVFYFGAAITKNFNPRLERYKSTLGTVRGINLLTKMFSFKLFHPDILAAIISKIFGFKPNKFSNTRSILAVFEQNKINSNIVKPHPTLRISEAELIEYNSHLEELKTILEDEAVSMDIPIIDRNMLWSAAHFSGPGISQFVSHENYTELNEFKNVFVTSSVLFSSHGYSNTGVSLAALSLYVASLVVERCSEKNEI